MGHVHASFRDLLEQRVRQCAEPPRPASRGWVIRELPDPGVLLFFWQAPGMSGPANPVATLDRFRRRPDTLTGGRNVRCTEAPPEADRAARSRGPARGRSCVSRPLTARQALALDTLRAAGAAELAPHSPSGDLKAAFRRLVLRYHPDRYPDCDEAARRELETTLAGIVEAYRELAAPEALAA